MRTLFEKVPGEEKAELIKLFVPTVKVGGPLRVPAPVELDGRFSIVTKGSVTAVHDRWTREPIRLYVFEEEDFLGEIAAFFGTSQTAGLQTQTGVEISSLKCDGNGTEQRRASQEENLLRLLKCPQVGLNIAEEMSWRLMRTVRYRDSDPAERICYAVALRELERTGHRSRVSGNPKVPRRGDLAAETGLDIRSVGNGLSKLLRDNIIERTSEGRKGEYTVVSWESLTRGLYL